MGMTLRAARVNAGMTQEDVHKQTGIARSTLISWERGKTSIRMDDLKTLCELYGTEVGEIDTGEREYTARKIGF